MALNYADREALRPALLPRIKEAVRKYLLYVQADSGAATENREWCTDNMANLTSLAEQLSHYCMSETAFIDNGTSITDAALQGRIESVINEHFFPA